MSPAPDTPETPTKVLAKSMFSFKVLTECPIIVVLLFQSYRRSAADNIMKFIPLIFQVRTHISFTNFFLLMLSLCVDAQLTS